ncbi:hypothetical protein ACUOCP_29770, partial [Escherichia sp. R-CC3]
RAIDLLRAEGDRLHSRKLRTFNEPPLNHPPSAGRMRRTTHRPAQP